MNSDVGKILIVGMFIVAICDILLGAARHESGDMLSGALLGLSTYIHLQRNIIEKGRTDLYRQLIINLQRAREKDRFVTVHQFLAREVFEYEQKRDKKPISGPPAG